MATKHTINIPYRLDLPSSINFCNKLQNLPEADEYLFDFSQINWVEPFGMLLVAMEIRRAIAKHKDKKFKLEIYSDDPNQNKAISYASHMGFFDFFIVGDYGKQLGEPRGGNRRYLPITVLDTPELEKEASHQFREIGQVVEDHSKLLAQTLTQQQDGDLVDTLIYSFREIIRNVVEHSKSGVVMYCAQFWPRNQLVEIAILDIGVGIRSTLSENPYLKIENDADALNLALIPGISGKIYKGKRTDPFDLWQNSGFGLYLTSRICRNGGNFFICSGDSGIFLDDSGKQSYSTNYEGTAIRLKLSTKLTETLRQLLNRFSQEGDAIAKEFSGDNYISVSRASRMLSNDFQTD